MRTDPVQEPQPYPSGLHASPRLGPYEARYDVRRGYDEPAPPGVPARRPAHEPVWIGRRRER